MARSIVLAALAGVVAAGACAEDSLKPLKVDAYPTWHAVGIEISYEGDADADGRAEFVWRRSGEEKWQRGVELTRDVKRRRWWGSVYPLRPKTAVEIKVAFADPDGAAPRELAASQSTRQAGRRASSSRRLTVGPGQSISAAVARLRAGDTLEVAPGVYRELVTLGPGASGAPGQPTVIISQGETRPVIDPSEEIPKGAQWRDEGGGVFSLPVKAPPVRVLYQDGRRVFGYNSLSELKADKFAAGRALCHDANAGRLHVRTGDAKRPPEHSYRVCRPGGFLFDGCSHVVVSNFEVRHASGPAVVIKSAGGRGGDGNALSGLYVTNCGMAVRIRDAACDGTRIWGCKFRQEGQIDFTWAALMGEHWNFPRDGVYLWTGRGTSVYGNRMEGFHNMISLEPHPGGAQQLAKTTVEGNRDLDIFYNELLNCSDDAIEADYGGVNMRIHGNSVRNSNSGVSIAPCVRGPVYVTRNTFTFRMLMFKFGIGSGTSHGESFCDHNSGYGLTPVATGIYFNKALPTTGKHFRNNVIIVGEDALLCMRRGNVLDGNCYWRHGGGVSKFNWGERWIKSIDEFRAASGMEKAGLRTDPKLAATPGIAAYRPRGYRVNSASGPARVRSVTESDFGLKPGSPCIDRGVAVRGLNDGFAGAAPDVGALEIGAEPTGLAAGPRGTPSPRPAAKGAASPAAPAKREAPAGPTPEQKAAAEKAIAGLKVEIIEGASAGRRARVYVDMAGRPTRARVVSADDEGVKVSAAGLEVKIKWPGLSPVRFYGIARRYSRDHAALADYCRGHGLVEEAEREAAAARRR